MAVCSVKRLSEERRFVSAPSCFRLLMVSCLRITSTLICARPLALSTYVLESPTQICFVISLPPPVFAVTAEIVEGKGRTGEPRIRCPVWLACVCTTRKKPQRICEASDCLRDDEITSLFSKSADDAADGFAAVSCSALNIIS